MKRIIIVEPDEDIYPSVTFYRIRFKDEEQTEFDKFFQKFDGDAEFEDDFNVILEYLDKIASEGALDEFLRREGGSLKAIPGVSNKLRLYCFRVNECILLLGNGGHKPRNIRTYQEIPELHKYVLDLEKTGKHLKNRVRNSTKASIYGCKLHGNLEFEIETT